MLSEHFIQWSVNKQEKYIFLNIFKFLVLLEFAFCLEL
jgi:hypothetical protein